MCLQLLLAEADVLTEDVKVSLDGSKESELASGKLPRSVQEVLLELLSLL